MNRRRRRTRPRSRLRRVADWLAVAGLIAAVAVVAARLERVSTREFGGRARVVDGDSLEIGAARIRLHLAVLAGDEGGQLVGMALDQLLEPEHHPRPIQRGRGRPCRKRRRRRAHRLADLGAGGQRNPAAGETRSRVVHTGPAAARSERFLAADEVWNRMERGRLLDLCVHGRGAPGLSPAPWRRARSCSRGRGRRLRR